MRSEDASNEDRLEDSDIKVILLGDSAVGKSKLMERFLEDEFNPRRVGTDLYVCFEGLTPVIHVNIYD